MMLLVAAVVNGEATAQATRVVAYLRDTTSIGGTLVAASGESVRLEHFDGTLHDVALDSVRSIAMIERRRDVRTLLALGLGYVGAVIFNGFDEHERTFVDTENIGVFAGALGGICVGTAIGGAVESPDLDRRTELSPTDTAHLRELLAAAPISSPARARWTVSAYMGTVVGTASASERALHVDAGFWPAYSYANVADRGAPFTVFRRIEISRATTGAFDIVATLVKLKQPSVYSTWSNIDSNDRYERRDIGTEIGGNGMLIGGRYVHRLDARRWFVRGGVSAGLAGTHLTRAEEPGYSSRRGSEEVTEQLGVAAMASIELVGRFDGFMFGLAADATVVPTLDVPPSRIADVGAGTANVSSACVGFTLGIDL